MKTIQIVCRTKDECIEKLNKFQDNIERVSGKKLTDFGRYCLELDMKGRDEYKEYIKFMEENEKDCVYTCKGKVIDYEIGRMLNEL